MSVQRTAAAASLALGSASRDVRVSGLDPILPSRFQLGAIASAALAELGCAAAELADQAGASTGAVETSAVEGARLLVSFGLQRLDGVALPRTNQSNPFVRSYQCSDDRWIYIHGGFEHLAQGLADLLGIEINSVNRFKAQMGLK